jgi:hypothetical protein
MRDKRTAGFNTPPEMVPQMNKATVRPVPKLKAIL